MNGKGGGSGVYGFVLWLAIRLLTRCFCNKGGNNCITTSLCFIVILVFSLSVLAPVMPEPLTVSIVTKFSCLAFFACLAARSLVPASWSVFDWGEGVVWTYGSTTLVVNLVGVKAGIKLVGLNDVSFVRRGVLFLHYYIHMAPMLLHGDLDAWGGLF